MAKGKTKTKTIAASSPLTYKSAGLDLKLYDQAMARLPALMQRTHTPRVMDLPGGFAGLFRMGQSRKFDRNYDDPVLVSGTDGVGTKLKLAALAKSYETVGIDLAWIDSHHAHALLTTAVGSEGELLDIFVRINPDAS